MQISQTCLHIAVAVAGVSIACPALAGEDAVARTGTSETLPTGDDGIYRERMLRWEAAPDRAYPSGEATVTLPFRMPLRHIQRRSSTFGMRRDPLGAGWRMHSGIDLPGVLGAPVIAAGPGVVRFAGWAGGYGNMVEIDHGDGVHTRYGHLLRSTVAPGMPVHAGTEIGLMGSTGRSTGSHLHYEMRLAGRAINPLESRLTVAQTVPVEAPDRSPPAPVKPRWLGWSEPLRDGQLPVAQFR